MNELILCDSFFTDSDFIGIENLSSELDYQGFEFGNQSTDKILIRDPDKTFSSSLGRDCIVDKDTSGGFVRYDPFIHFSSYTSINDWCFIVAITQTTFNLFKHRGGARKTTESTDLPFQNFTEWNYTTNIILEKNQGLFFRPWLFHSIQGGLVQQYNMSCL